MTYLCSLLELPRSYPSGLLLGMSAHTLVRVATAEIETAIGPMIAAASETHLLLFEFPRRRMIETQLDRVRRAHDCELAPGESPDTARGVLCRASARFYRAASRARHSVSDSRLVCTPGDPVRHDDDVRPARRFDRAA